MRVAIWACIGTLCLITIDKSVGASKTSSYRLMLVHIESVFAHSSVAIILMGKRKLVALLTFSSWWLVMVEWLFLAVPWGCLRFVIVVFPDHTHLLFLITHSVIPKKAGTAIKSYVERLNNTNLIINRKRQQKVSLMTNQAQICNKRSTSRSSTHWDTHSLSIQCRAESN